MKLKNEKCILIIAPFNEKSSLVIKDLLDSNLKIRIVTDNLKEFKKLFFDVWEKFENVSQLELNYSKFIKHKEKYFEPRNGTAPEYIMFLKLQNSKENLFLHEMEFINFLQTQKQIKKFIYVEINNIQRTFSFNFRSSLTQAYSKNPIQNILDYYLEAAIRQSGINYLIIKNLEVRCNSSVFGEDHITFSNLSDYLLQRINLFNYKNFKELIYKIIDQKIFVSDSTYTMDKHSYDSIIKYSTPQFIYDYYNYLYKDSYFKKLSRECNIVKEDLKQYNTSRIFSVLSIALGIKMCSFSIRFFINNYK